MGAERGLWIARAVIVRRGRGRPRTITERLPEPMGPREVHEWVRAKHGDRAAYWPLEFDWQDKR
jgi:hypothetical protein